MTLRTAAIAAAMALGLSALGQDPGPAPAQSVLDGAMKAAKSGKKPILLVFGASW